MNLEKNTKNEAFGFVLMAITVTLLFCATAASGQNVPKGNVSITDCASELPFMLLQIQADVLESLNDLDENVAKAAQNLSVTGLEGRKLAESFAICWRLTQTWSKQLRLERMERSLQWNAKDAMRAARALILAAAIYWPCTRRI